MEDYLNISAPVFDIQTYSIHDGPGIRVTVYVKGCPLRCQWCHNPESNLPYPQLMTYRSKCTGCGKCIPVCPAQAITVRLGEDRAYAVTDREKCTNCGVCVSACPTESREISGRNRTVGEVVAEVRKDKIFMDASGGGMTLSGGECMMYPDFSAALLYACRQEGIHTAIESCSFASRETVNRIVTQADLCLLDIKHMDSAKHKELTGVPNEQILDNIRYIYHELKKPVIIRVPVVPGCNDSDENIAATARFTHDELGPDVAMHLLPYHAMGNSKIESLGGTVLQQFETPDDEHMLHLKDLVAGFGIKVQIGG